jgi:hypothetical protein
MNDPCNAGTLPTYNKPIDNPSLFSTGVTLNALAIGATVAFSATSTLIFHIRQFDTNKQGDCYDLEEEQRQPSCRIIIGDERFRYLERN